MSAALVSTPASGCVVSRSQPRASSSAKAAPVALGSTFTQGAAGKGFLGNGVAGLKLEASARTGSRGTRSVTTMAAKVAGYIKLAIEAGKANPSPPIGPALGAQGVNIMDFCKQYNAATQDKAGSVIPVEITVYADKSFTFILKTPPASVLLKKAAGVGKGASNGCRDKVGEITTAQLREIAEIKMPDLNANDVEAGMRIVKGTADNMGIVVSDWAPAA